MKEEEEVKDEKKRVKIQLSKRGSVGVRGQKRGARERKGKSWEGKGELHVILCMEIIHYSEMTQMGMVGSKVH